MIFRSRTARLTAIAGLALAGTIAFGIAMFRAGRPLAPNTIVTFELAFQPGRAAAIMETWKEPGRAAARRSLLLDVGFIVLGYVPLLWALCLRFSRRPRKGKPPAIGHWLALAAIAAGVLDLIENAALWGVLRSPANPSGALTWLAGIAAAAKFLLVACAVVYCVIGLGRALARVTPLVQWFLSYPVLLFLAVVVLAIVWRVALAPFGIPDLFWDEEWKTQIVAGAGVGALLSHLGVMGFLLDSRRAARSGGRYWARWAKRIAVKWVVPWVPALGEGALLLSGYLVRTTLPLLLAALGAIVVAPDGVSRWWLPVGAVVFFVFYSAVCLWLAENSGFLFTPPDPVASKISRVPLPKVHLLAFNLILFLVAFYVVLALLYAGLGQRVYVALAVCVLLAAIASAYGFLKFFFSGRTFGLLTGFVVAFAALNSLGGHRLAGLDYLRRPSVRDWARLPAETLLQPSEHLDAWQARRGGGKPPLVVVAVDGGGIRAAVWATVVLTQLESDLADFPYFVRVVTGASGGMVGMASYVGSLQPPGGTDRHRDLDNQPLAAAELIHRVARDSLGTVARELVFKDLLLPPALHPYSDRGHALERAWEGNTNILGQPFAALAAGEAEGWRPSLIVSPFLIEDGRRLLISNLDLGALSTIPVEPPPARASLQAIEYFRMIETHPGPVPLARDHPSLRLSTAARLNASFPYVSPAAELPTDPPRRVLDAGYYDNHGVDLAGTWIWTNRDWLREHTSGVLLVQIPEARSRLRRRDADERREDFWGAGLIGVTGPLQALRTSGSAAADYRNDQLVRFLRDALKPGEPGFFETVVFEPDETTTGRFPEIALSWHLTSFEVRRLEDGIRGEEGRPSCLDRRRLQAWWIAKTTPTAAPPEPLRCPPDPVEPSQR